MAIVIEIIVLQELTKYQAKWLQYWNLQRYFAKRSTTALQNWI